MIENSASSSIGGNISVIFIDICDVVLKNYTLLHINCEGSEFEIIERLYKCNKLNFFKYLMIGTHSIPWMKCPTPACKYCKMHHYLKQNFDAVEFSPFAWEHWIRKK